MNATIPLTSFTGGEWSPRLYGRVDIQKYNTACEVLQNMVIYPHGGITRRMGMEYIEDTKSPSTNNDVRLIPFEYNREQAYVLEFGQGYIRFFRNGAQIAPLGVPLEVSTNLFSTPGHNISIAEVGYAQSNDVLYIVCDKKKPQKLTRTGPDTFTIADVTFTSPPSEWTTDNYPTTVTFFQNRLVFGGCPKNPQKIWLSKAANLEDFTTGTLASDALVYTLSSTQNNAIQWVEPGLRLMIGTAGGEFTMDLPGNDGLSVQVQRESNFGSKNRRSQLIGNGVIYTSRDGKKLREMSYSYQDGGFVSPELSLYSQHLTTSGIKECDYAQNPDGVLWTVMNDGSLAGFTYLKSQEVQGWHRHVTDGQVMSVCTIENDDASEVWFLVMRNSKIRVERMAAAFTGTSPNDVKCAYFDSYLTYEGDPVTTVSGLDHLEGKTVGVMGDGFYLQDQIVTGGSITIEKACGLIIVGLKYQWKLIPLRLEGGSPTGLSQGKKKHIESLIVRFENSAGVVFNIKGGTYGTELPGRKFGDSFDTPINFYSGDKFIKLQNNWGRDGQFELSGDGPFPVTIIMIGAQVAVNE